MIKQEFKVKHYWKVIVYYDIDYNLFEYIVNDLYSIVDNVTIINRIYYNMYKRNAKGVTISNIEKHISVVLFNKHKVYKDYINTIVHEAEHIKQAILKAYDVPDKGELPAYTIGYIAMKMLMILKHL